MDRKVSVEALLYDGLVFEGTVLELDTIYGKYKGREYPESAMATFRISTWISSHDVSDTITVYTNVGGCGIRFTVGEQWLIYADEFDGILSTSICSPSMKMMDKADTKFANTLAYLKKLKSTTGRVEESDDWYQGEYKIFGSLKGGVPVGQWLRVRENDTIAIFNFNPYGRRHGYQMEENENYDARFESVEEVSEDEVKSFDPQRIQLRSVYALKHGRRNGKFEIYSRDELLLKASYHNGQLHGEHIRWHEDTSIAKGKIKTVKQFSRGKLISTIAYDEAGNVVQD